MEADFLHFEHLTDVLGSMTFIKRYSLITLMFATAESHPVEDITKFLQDALARLAVACPFLAGKVIYAGRDETHSGIRKIVPHQGTIPLVVKDLVSGQLPSFNEMMESGCPMAMLDPEVLVPPIAITWASDGYDKLAPVLILQANFIRGGLLLTVAGNHATMDMTGLGIVIAHLSKACRDEPFTEEEIGQANQDRRSAIPLLGPNYQPGNELDDSFINLNAPSMSVKPSDWAYFSCNPSALTALKGVASQQTIVPYISTDDAISALFWQRISAVRAQLYPETFPRSSHLARTVSARSFLGLRGYIGHMVDCVYCTLENIPSLSLGKITGHLRALVLNKDKIVHHTRAFATVLDRMNDKTRLINGAQLDPNWDIVVSSYGNLKCCDLEFGGVLGGRPLAARRPRMAGWPSLCYIMPADRGGNVNVAVCLPDEEMTALQVDEVLGRYARFVD